MAVPVGFAVTPMRGLLTIAFGEVRSPLFAGIERAPVPSV